MESARKGNRILLVDDEPDIVMAFKLTLESAGFNIDTHEDPLNALSKFKPSYYDLVILDIKMPKMNGFELYTEMQKIDNQVKVCFITAGEMHYEKIRKGKLEEDEEEEEQYCELNTERFLQKPISNADLIKRINKIMMLNLSPNIQNT
jgi:DNA-binding response OmpR family regulator